ncbi:hypothetical protein KAI65_01230 [Candidatus Parcubacteria bacterium]|nr:hypothetical protein [Candidatus Parcubacteria bacterium]
MEQQNNAKFAFFYMLSLFSLIFMAIAVGMIIFQIINKEIVDIITDYRGRYEPDALKSGISSLIIATPIFFITMRQIYKNLFLGILDKDSAIRKWLSYFILFVSSVVMIIWLIMTINSFLDGELTFKFFLKALTALAIAASIFTFYFYDIKRKEVKEKKDLIIRIYFYASLIVIISVFIASLFVVESPMETRNRKTDEAVLNDFNSIDNAVQNYFREKERLPESLTILKDEFPYITEDDLKHPSSNENYAYNKLEDKKYELCASFLTSNISDTDLNGFNKEMWPHDSGAQCLSRKIEQIYEPRPQLLR